MRAASCPRAICRATLHIEMNAEFAEKRRRKERRGRWEEGLVVVSV